MKRARAVSIGLRKCRRYGQNSFMRDTSLRRLASLLALIACVTGCSSFERQWKRAASAPADGIAGRWIGRWHSDANGHNDQLRCIITPSTNGTYSARYHARYTKWALRFTFGYTVPLKVGNRDGRFEFTGESNLGWYAGGVYRYKGSATATNFTSTYDSKYDHGTFEMGRP